MGTGRHRVRMRVWIVCLLLALVIGSLNARGGRLSSSSSRSTGSSRSSSSSSRSRSTIFIPNSRPSTTHSSGSIFSETEDSNSIWSSSEDSNSIWSSSEDSNSIWGKTKSKSDDSDESGESDESTDDGDQLAEVTLAVTLEEQVASLRNGTQTNNRTLSRLEAFYEELERRILRLEAANNGTRDVPESVDESLTSPAPETTTYTPCCRKIKLKSRGSMTRYRASDAFLGVYVLDEGTEEGLTYRKVPGPGPGSETILSITCGQDTLIGFYTEEDFRRCRDPVLNFVSGFSGSCITGPSLFTVSHNNGETVIGRRMILCVLC